MSRFVDCFNTSHLLHSLLNKKGKKRDAIEYSVSWDIFVYCSLYLKTRTGLEHVCT